MTDPYVLRILINNNRIERTYLSSTREEGQAIVDGLPSGGLVWSADGHIVRSYGPGLVIFALNFLAIVLRRNFLQGWCLYELDAAAEAFRFQDVVVPTRQWSRSSPVIMCRTCQCT